MSAAALEQAAIFGVTTNLDLFTDPSRVANIRKQQSEGKLANHADLLSSGYLATAPGGHGTDYSIKVPTLRRSDEAQARVDARICTRAAGEPPITRTFVAGPEWNQFEWRFAEVGDDVDGSDVTAIMWAMARTGEYELVRDDVKLQ